MAERVDLLGTSNILPKEAAKTLIAAYEDARQYPSESLTRALIVDLAIKKVKKQYEEFFRCDQTQSCERNRLSNR